MNVSSPSPHQAQQRPPLANAVLGNGSLLMSITSTGAVQQIWWPHVDRDTHLGRLRIACVDNGNTDWMDAPDWTATQTYADATSSVLTTTLRRGTASVTFTDLVLPDASVFVRQIRGTTAPILVELEPAIGGTVRAGGAYVDPATGVLVCYRRDQYLAIGVDTPATATASCDPNVTATQLLLDGHPGGGLAFGQLDAAILTRPGDTGMHLVCALADTADAAIALVSNAHAAGIDQLTQQRRAADAAILSHARLGSADPAIRLLEQRSHLLLSMLADRTTGGIIAAPEADPDFTISGGYGYVWPRDLAFILLALLASGRHDLAVPALQWLPNAQHTDGLWLQRHWADGRLAPAWGTQLDETGGVLFAYEQAWQHLQDPSLDAQLWPSTVAAADALVRTLDPDSGLPAASRDLWEERLGVHTFTAAAVCAGLEAAATMAMRHDSYRADGWRQAANRLRQAIDDHLWSDTRGRYLRSIQVARNDDHSAPPPPGYLALGHPEQPVASVDLIDDTIDVSLLGLTYPFGLLAPDDPRMAATIDAVKAGLSTVDGGLLRYAGDRYAGGNPWILARLWLALARQDTDDLEPAGGLAYAARVATGTQLLAEQIDAVTGEPAWIVPLTWSHAMLLLAAHAVPQPTPVAAPAEATPV